MSTDNCEGPLHPRAMTGVLLVNKGKYFDAHEELEAAWKEERSKVRELYQGILEAAVTYLHITWGNYPGAVKVHARSMRWLNEWPETCRGVDVGQLRRDLDAAITEVKRLGSGRLSEFDQTMFKPILLTENH